MRLVDNGGLLPACCCGVVVPIGILQSGSATCDYPKGDCAKKNNVLFHLSSPFGARKAQ